MIDTRSPAFREFAREHANWDGLREVCLTFDLDFAPEYMIEDLLAVLDRFEARATFYVTHHSRVIAGRSRDPRFEIGLHPNLGAGSTQGRTLPEILGALLEHHPEARGSRFHRLAHAYRDLADLRRAGMRYDVSGLRFNCPYVLPAWHADVDLVLLTYTWEDGICENARLPMTMDSIDLASPGMKILNFHPLNVFINGPTSEERLRFMEANPDLPSCPREVAERWRSPGPGAGDVLAALLAEVRGKGCRLARVGEVADAYRALASA